MYMCTIAASTLVGTHDNRYRGVQFTLSSLTYQKCKTTWSLKNWIETKKGEVGNKVEKYAVNSANSNIFPLKPSNILCMKICQLSYKDFGYLS